MIIGIIRGQVIAVGQLQQGVGKSGKPWQKQDYVVQSEGAYPKKVAFSIMNDKIQQANIQMGHTVEAEVNIESREYNGKWYTDLSAYRVDNLSVAAPAQNQSVYQQTAPQGYSSAPTPQAPPYQQMPPQGYAAPQTAQPYGLSNDTDLAF